MENKNKKALENFNALIEKLVRQAAYFAFFDNFDGLKREWIRAEKKLNQKKLRKN